MVSDFVEGGALNDGRFTILSELNQYPLAREGPELCCGAQEFGASAVNGGENERGRIGGCSRGWRTGST
jgi:hypothetical protein